MAKPKTFDEEEDQAIHSTDESESSEDFPETNLDTDDDTSSSGSSSEEEEDEEHVENHETTSTITPQVLDTEPTTSPTALKLRLASFIPKLQAANAKLETDPDAGAKRIDEVPDDVEQYIEMNLGLGVLKTKVKPAVDGVRTVLEEDSDDSDDESTSGNEDPDSTEASIIDRLKGVRPPKRNIEEVG